MKILDEFKLLFNSYEKKYKNQATFRSMKLMRNANGVQEPVFYVGVPGLMVAIVITLVTLATVYLLYLPFMWYVWTPYIIAVFFLFRVAMKYDKARQIRFMVYYMLNLAVSQMELAEKKDDGAEKKQHADAALDWLEKADKWVDEPAIRLQIDTIKNS
jgi:hypothetical protein